MMKIICRQVHGAAISGARSAAPCRLTIIANLNFLINTQKTKPALRKSVRFVSWLCCLRMMRLAGPCGQGGGLEQGRQQMPGIRPGRADRGDAGLRGRCESAHSRADGSTKCGFDVYYMGSILPARLRRGGQPCPVTEPETDAPRGTTADLQAGSRPASR